MRPKDGTGDLFVFMGLASTRAVETRGGVAGAPGLKHINASRATLATIMQQMSMNRPKAPTASGRSFQTARHMVTKARSAASNRSKVGHIARS